MPLPIGYSYNPKTGQVENNLTRGLTNNRKTMPSSSTEYQQRMNEIVGSNVSDATKLDRLVEMGVPMYEASRLVKNHNHQTRTNQNSLTDSDIAFLNKQNKNEVQ